MFVHYVMVSVNGVQRNGQSTNKFSIFSFSNIYAKFHVCNPIHIIPTFLSVMPTRLLCTNSSNYTHTKWSVAVSPEDNVVVSPELEISIVGGTVAFTCSTQGSPNNAYQ